MALTRHGVWGWVCVVCHAGQARLFQPEPAGFPYIEQGAAGVCGEDKVHYATAAAAAAAGARVANCGPCGVCSSTQDVGTYHNMSGTLTKEATKCGILFLFGDSPDHGRALAATPPVLGVRACWHPAQPGDRATGPPWPPVLPRMPRMPHMCTHHTH